MEKEQKEKLSMVEIAEMETQRVVSGVKNEIHLWLDGKFLRAYEWSAWLSFRLMHDFKVNKRRLKGRDEPVAYIGFPESSMSKWLPEGMVHQVVSENHLVLTVGDAVMQQLGDDSDAEYAAWHESIPLTETREREKNSSRSGENTAINHSSQITPASMTSIMQRILAFPIESKSPLESMAFLAEVKQQLAMLF